MTRRRLRLEAAAATCIQSAVRGQQLRRHQRRREAALLIRKWLKGRAQRHRFQRQRAAATVLQKALRGAHARGAYQKSLKAARQLTALIRWWLLHRKDLKRSGAAVAIQAVWRGKLARQHQRLQGSAALCIQTAVRRHLTAKLLRARVAAAVSIQAQSRRWLALRHWARLRAVHDATLYLAKCRAALRHTAAMRSCSSRLGAAARRYLTVQDLAAREAAACHIQRIVRGCLARREIEVCKASGVLGIQNLFRSGKGREAVEFRRAEAVQLEELARLQGSRAEEQVRWRAAVTIQRCVRMAQAHQHFWQRLRPALLKLQAFARRVLVRMRLLRQRAAVECLQRWWRCQLVVNHLQRKHEAAKKIQHAFGRYIIRCYSDQMDSSTRRAVAAQSIQAAWRGHLRRRSFLTKQRAAVSIQALARGSETRKLHRRKVSSATAIQTAVARRRLGVKKAEKKRDAALKVQAFGRRVLACRQASKKRNAVLKIQAMVRQLQCQSRVRAKRHNAAVRIQAYVRMVLLCPRSAEDRRRAPASVRARRAAVLRLQATFRGCLARMWMASRQQAALRIQSKVRQWRASRQWQKRMGAILVIQSFWKGLQARRRLALQRAGFIKAAAFAKGTCWRQQEQRRLWKAATHIQSTVRGWQTRSKMASRLQAALRIQKMRRGIVTRRWFNQVQSARFTLRGLIYRFRWRKRRQAMINLNACLGRVVKAYLPEARKRHIKNSAVTIQRIYRGWRGRQEFDKRLQQAARLQVLSRIVTARTNCSRMQKAATTIQAAALRLRARHQMQRCQRSVLLIQASTRGRQSRRYALKQAQAATQISRIARGKLLRLKQARRHDAVVRVQAAVRSWLVRRTCSRREAAARCLQRAWRNRKAWLSLRRQHQAVTKLAAAFRCRRARKSFSAVRQAGAFLVGAAFMWRQMHLLRCRRNAATRISAVWRGFSSRRSTYKLREAVSRIQRWWHDVHTCRSVRDSLFKVRVVRSNLRQFHLNLHAASIQRAWKMQRLRRRGIRLLKRAVVRLQAHYRRWRATIEAAELRAERGFVRASRLPFKEVALVPDSRGQLTRHTQLLPNDSASKTSRVLHAQALPASMLDKVEVVLEPLQAFLRHRYRQRCILRLQRVWRGRLCRRMLGRQRQAALRIQAAWRGALVRMRVLPARRSERQ